MDEEHYNKRNIPLTTWVNSGTMTRVEAFRVRHSYPTMSGAVRTLIKYGVLYEENYLSGKVKKIQKVLLE